MTLGLLFGILWLAIFIRMFVKFPTGSSGSRTDSYFKSDAALSEKAFQLALESFQLLFVSKVEAHVAVHSYREMIATTQIMMNLPRKV